MTPRPVLPRWQISSFAATIGASVAAILLAAGDAADTAIFGVAALAMIGLAWVVGLATEQLAATSGPKLSAILNAAFGNVAELVLVLLAVHEGLGDVAKAAIAGSVLGNALFVLGLAFALGGLRNGTQRFNREIAGLNAVLLAVAVLGLVVPTVFAETAAPSDDRLQGLSDAVSIVFLVLYALFVTYYLRGGDGSEHDAGHHDVELVPWSRKVALTVLLAAGAGVAVLGDILVGSLEPAAESIGVSPVFMGLIAVPVIGNLAEHMVAVQLAWRNRMDFSLNIAMGSTLQIVLFMAPVIVLLSPLLADGVPLTFSFFELTALAGGAVAFGLVAADGESNWVEGAALVGVYLVVALTALFWPA
ncbi:MAG: calcium/proton exchanger [Actinomycetota bacterium]